MHQCAEGLLGSVDFWRRGATWLNKQTYILDALKVARNGPDAAR